MGAVFCNVSTMRWNTTTPLTHALLQEQRIRECSKVGSIYLTDNEVSLQAIHKWIGGGAKLNFSRSPDVDVLKDIVLKLQKRVEAGATTLMIKVKDHRGDPLNEESDIRTKLGRLKEYKETIWNDSSDRTAYE